MISQAVGCQHTRLSGLGERHFDGFPSLVCNIQEDEGWVKGFFVAFQAAGCQHTGLGGLGERHLTGFPGCKLPTYRARRVG